LTAEVLRRFDVVNRGFSGYNTSNALSVLPKVFAPPGPGVPELKYLVSSSMPHGSWGAELTLGDQFILFGANDAAVPLPTNFQHVPLDKYKANLTRIVNHPIITSHKPKIFIVTPPPLDQIRVTVLDMEHGHPAAARQTKVSAAYSEAARQVAAENAGVTLIDLHKALMYRAIEMTPGFDPKGPALGDPEGGIRGYLEHLLPDGLHLSAESYRIFYDLVRPHIDVNPPSRENQDRTGWVLPDWREAPWLEEDSHLKGKSV
jgi:lysophospholipase L1-like esterase